MAVITPVPLTKVLKHGSLFFLLLAIFIICTTLPSFALISFSSPSDSYRLGDIVSITAHVESPNANISQFGFFSVSLRCGDQSIEYYRIPLTIDETLSKDVDIESIVLTKDLTGDSGSCFIDGSLLGVYGSVIELSSSPTFDVDKTFPLTLEIDTNSVYPDSTLEGTAVVSTPARLSDKYMLHIYFDGKTLEFSSSTPTIPFVIPVKKTIQPGQSILIASVTDKYGNSADAQATLIVPVVVSRVENQYERTLLYANASGEGFEFLPQLFDQTGKQIRDTPIQIIIIDPTGTLIINQTIDSAQKFLLGINDSFKPGNYSVVTAYGNTTQSDVVTVDNPGYAAKYSPLTGLSVLENGPFFMKSVFWLWVLLFLVFMIFFLLYREFTRRKVVEHSVPEGYVCKTSWHERMINWIQSQSSDDTEKTYSSTKVSSKKSGNFVTDNDGYIDLTHRTIDSDDDILPIKNTKPSQSAGSVTKEKVDYRRL